MTSNEIIKRVKKVCPKFSAVTLSMIKHAEDYGVVFSVKAMKALGEIPELPSATDAEELISSKIIKKNSSSQKRKKSNKKRISISLNEDEAIFVKLRTQSLGMTEKEYLYNLLEGDILNEFK